MAPGTPATTPQKRVLPARERRESATKREASEANLSIAAMKSPTARKASTLKQTAKPAPTLRGSKRRKTSPVRPATPRRPSTPLVDETLPLKIAESKPLPTLLQPQPANLSSEEYQSIAESAVLSASLYRSRVRWLADGVFERYWTKPTKKKMAEGLTNNPDLKSMQKLGACTITIGPHTYEAIIYMVRDAPAPRLQPSYPPRPLQPTFQNYQAQAAPQPLQQGPPLARSPALPAVSSLLNTPGSLLNAPGLQPVPPAVQRPTPTASATVKPESPAGVVPTPPAAPPSGPDPVIRLLATRAASNPHLKELMKVVASSKATPEQLQAFQSHIDDLNKVIRGQQEGSGAGSETVNSPLATNQSPAPIAPSSSPRPHSPQIPLQHPTPQYPAGPASRPPVQAMLKANPSTGPPGSPLAHPAHPAYPSPKLSAPEPQIKAIVLEFTTPAPSSGSVSPDRYLFPEYAVLDTPISGHGREMICSFLVVRKGADIVALQAASTHPVGGVTRWLPSREYYEPVTMTIKTAHNKILENIAHAARPLPEVQEKIKEIMRTKTRASLKDEWLAARLPRENGPASQP